MGELEKYLDSLQKNNNYCLCKDMHELYSLRKNAEQMIREGSLEINQAIRKYDAKLTFWVNNEKLELQLHDIKTDVTKKILPSDIEEDKAITVHCPTCHNQIDVISQ